MATIGSRLARIVAAASIARRSMAGSRRARATSATSAAAHAASRWTRSRYHVQPSGSSTARPATAVRSASSGRPSHSASSVAAAWYAPWNWPSTGAPWSSSRSRSSWKRACSNSPRPTSSGIQRARPYRLAGGFDCSMSRTRASSAAWSQCPSSMAIMTALWPMNVP